MNKRIGIIMILIGAVLIFSALLLFAYNAHENQKAEEAAKNVLADLRSILEERSAQNETTKAAETDIFDENSHETETAATETMPETIEQASGETSSEMSVVEIDGNGYIGFITIHALGVELPVMDDWSYEKLKIAPCRQFGSTKTDDLVIAAHNYRAQFADLYKLQKGAVIVFTDMDNVITHYTVETTNYLNPEAVEKVHNSKYDLVLYTCTYSGDTRVAVFCDRMESMTKDVLNKE